MHNISISIEQKNARLNEHLSYKLCGCDYKHPLKGLSKLQGNGLENTRFSKLLPDPPEYSISKHPQKKTP